MAPILSACLELYRCGDEADETLRCIQNADIEVSVFLSDNSPEELTAERLKWAFPGVILLSHEKNSGLARAHNAVLPELRSKYHLMLSPGVIFGKLFWEGISLWCCLVCGDPGSPFLCLRQSCFQPGFVSCQNYFKSIGKE